MISCSIDLFILCDSFESLSLGGQDEKADSCDLLAASGENPEFGIWNLELNFNKSTHQQLKLSKVNTIILSIVSGKLQWINLNCIKITG
ncbi:MAG: hypothetical protein HC906_14805 [Bacteroidales bacterium]|nr:hypothetical protein [Bacteroidales bacterium]